MGVLRKGPPALELIPQTLGRTEGDREENLASGRIWENPDSGNFLSCVPVESPAVTQLGLVS